MPADRVDILVKNLERNPGILNGGAGSIKFGGGTDKNTDFMRKPTIAPSVLEPLADGFDFSFGGIKDLDFGSGPLNTEIAPRLSSYSIYIRDGRGK